MILGLTGLAGVGKSTAARYFLDIDPDAYHIDLDQLGHQAHQDQGIKDQLFKRFGKDIFNGTSINRAALGKIVFENVQALLDLNQLMHPWMREQVKIQLQKEKHRHLIVIEGALLDEMSLIKYCDQVLLIEADLDQVLESRPQAKKNMEKSTPN